MALDQGLTGNVGLGSALDYFRKLATKSLPKSLKHFRFLQKSGSFANLFSRFFPINTHTFPIAQTTDLALPRPNCRKKRTAQSVVW